MTRDSPMEASILVLMGKYDWYQAKTWDADAEAEFEARIKRQREWRPQYTVIQGRTLLESEFAEDRSAGRALLRRVITEFGASTEFVPRTEVATAWGELASSLHRDGHIDEALTAFDSLRLALEAAPEVHGVRFRLAQVDLLIEIGDEDSTDQAFLALDALDLAFESKFLFPSDEYEIALRAARLNSRRGRSAAAAEHARTALELASDPFSVSWKHPTLGVVAPDDRDLAELRDIASAEGGRGQR